MIYELNKIKGIGETTEKFLKRQGIFNTYNLVSYLPKNYENFYISQYNELKHNEIVTVVGKIVGPIKSYKSRVEFISSYIELDNKKIKILIFGRSYIKNQLKEEQEVLIKGKYHLFKNEINVTYISVKTSIPELKPIYGIENVNDSNISKYMKQIYDENIVDLYETLPSIITEKYEVLDRKSAYYKRHFPTSIDDINEANYRFKIEEGFEHLLKYLYFHSPKKNRSKIDYDINQVKKQIDLIPYQLTLDQQEAVNDIFKDFKRNNSNYRLIQGDVGSGKTMVSFIAAIGMISAGYQVAFMAPTQILARQHYESFIKIFKDYSAALLTSSISDKKDVLNNIKDGSFNIIFGTHSLSSDYTVFNNLGLVIIDEQHKFGVDVRDKLIDKSLTKDVIYLTATPIPRSLSLTFFGDLEVSNIKTKPSNRKEVKTLVAKDDLSFLIQKLNENSKKNQQSFIVVPSILESKNSHSIESVYQSLEPYINPDNFYVLHGKLSDEEIELIMERFTKNEKGILLATSIIEVGIDVKNASTIFILSANNFGLSSLHQLRGRVGRGDLEGTCYLISDKEDNERLEFLKNNNDGFKLAEYDLLLRGPGVFSSIIQSGKYKFDFLDLTNDLNLLKKLKSDVKIILENLDKFPHLKKRLSNLMI